MLDHVHSLTTAPPIAAFKLSEDFRKLAPKLKSAASDDSGEDKGTREALTRALEFLALYYRDLLSYRVSGAQYLVNVDRETQIASASARFAPEDLTRALTDIAGVRHAVERNANAQLAVDVLFTRLTAG
jgi:hypothetical protein